MNKFFAAGLILLLFFSGCTKEKTDSQKIYQINLSSYSADFENKKIDLNIFSKEELQKTRIEIIDSDKMTNFGYFNLKKGENSISIECNPDKKNFSVEITPSDGTTKKFEIEIKLKENIYLKKGFKYYFQSQMIKSGAKRDHNIFILDENSGFFKAVAYSPSPENKEFFSFFLIDKNSFEIYASGAKKTCFEAFNSGLKRDFFDEEELIVLLPLFLFYIQSDPENKEKGFSLNEFIAKKQYSLKDGSYLYELKIDEKLILNGREVYRATQKVNGKENAELYFQAEPPNIMIQYKGSDRVLDFREMAKEEFNGKKYSCFSD